MMKRNDIFEQLSSKEALEHLKEGNKRYLQSQPSGKASAEIRAGLALKGQVPFAVILGCSDSRVVPEVIFDVGIGELFVVRTAGNVADKVAIGSIEFAVEFLKARLIVVLGHEECAAVLAAIAGGDYGSNMAAVISLIKPAVDKVRTEGKVDDFSRRCEDEHIKNTAERLKESAVLSKYLAEGTLLIAGAKYGLETGKVSFF
ncbi:MAG: carbonic anhydrase [Lachnospiraceae bacterium]|nr:carbonic anhydrase [Lachnospiraceae bacterium]